MKPNPKVLLLVSAALVACSTRGERTGVARSAIGPNWVSVTGMPAARSHPAVCKLTETLMLVAGGYDSSGSAQTTTYVYDLSGDSWTTVGSLNTARGQAKGIESGTVTVNSTTTNKCLAVAGRSAPPGSGSELSSVEEFQLSALSPPSGSWTNKTSLNTARYTHTVNKFGSSTFLVAGGINAGTIQNTAELYDPNGSSSNYNLVQTNGRAAHASMNHDDNTVLLSGGTTTMANATSTAEVWHNSSGTITSWATGNMTTTRTKHGVEAISETGSSAAEALAIGGKNNAGSVLNSAETYHSSTWTSSDAGSWTTNYVGSLTTARYNFRIAQTGTTNKLLVVSGVGSNGDTVSTSETWDGTTSTPWNFAGQTALQTSRWAEGHAVYLGGGGGTSAAVVIASGTNISGGTQTTLSAAEKY